MACVFVPVGRAMAVCVGGRDRSFVEDGTEVVASS